MAPPQTADERLATCHGYLVTAGDRQIGRVETPVFAFGAREPDQLIVRTSDSIAGTFRVVPASLVEDLDPERRLIRLAVGSDALAAFPERLPLERR